MPKLLAAVMMCLVSCMLVSEEAQADEVLASCYGAESGGLTASGEPFVPGAMTTAHPYLPFGTELLVSHAGRSVVAVVNDRGPAAWTGRGLDLSCGAMGVLGLPPGVYVVDVLIL